MGPTLYLLIRVRKYKLNELGTSLYLDVLTIIQSCYVTLLVARLYVHDFTRGGGGGVFAITTTLVECYHELSCATVM